MMLIHRDEDERSSPDNQAHQVKPDTPAWDDSTYVEYRLTDE